MSLSEFIVDPRVMAVRMFKKQIAELPDNTKWYRMNGEGYWYLDFAHTLKVPYDIVERNAPEVPNA